jgi:protein-tyrosine-phosphatase
MNILFICKYNRFRSKIAEAYFNTKKNSHKVYAKSAGLVSGIPISNNIFQEAKRFGLNITGKPKGLTHQLLMWSDKIIIISDKIPKSILEEEIINDKKEVIIWKIRDAKNSNRSEIIKSICVKVDGLLKELKIK